MHVRTKVAVENLQKDYGMDSPWHVVDRLEKRGSKRRQDDVYLPMTDIRMRRSGGPLTMTDIRMKKEGWQSC